MTARFDAMPLWLTLGLPVPLTLYAMPTKETRLTFLRRVPAPGKALYRCSCGKTITTTLKSVKSGRSKSCGCLRAEMMRVARLNEGITRKFERDTGANNGNT